MYVLKNHDLVMNIEHLGKKQNITVKMYLIDIPLSIKSSVIELDSLTVKVYLCGNSVNTGISLMIVDCIATVPCCNMGVSITSLLWGNTRRILKSRTKV